MKRILTLALVLNLTVIAQAQRLSGDIMLSYTLSNNLNLGLSGKSIYPFVAGINGALKLSKKKYSPLNINIYGGVRYSRSGYWLESYLDTRPEFYKENNLSRSYDDTNSKLIHSYFNVPVGIEFKFNTNPVIFKKINTFALAILLNNSFLLSSKLDESVYSFTVEDNVVTQSKDLKPFLEFYYPGLALELRFCTYLNLGLSWHEVSFQKAEAELDFDGKSASPLYEMITDDGKYKDMSIYLGVNIPLKSKKAIRKHAE
jgi:hypothetical protein